MNSIMTGRAAEHIFIAKCLLLGMECYLPTSTHGRIDVIVGKLLSRCQVKVIGDPNGQGSRGLSLRKVGCNSASNVKQYRYSSDDADFFVGVDLDNFDCFIVPLSMVTAYSRTISVNALVKLETKNSFSRLLGLAPPERIELPSLVLETRAQPLDHSGVSLGDQETGALPLS